MRHALILATVLAACGCSQATATPLPATSATPTTKTAGGMTLGLGEITVYFASMPSEKVHADGTIETFESVFANDKGTSLEWVKFGTITPEGEVRGSAGQVVWTLLSDGTVKVSSGETEHFKLREDAIDAAGHHVTIDANGIVQGLNPGYDIRVEGATSAAEKRTALLIVALWNASSFE